MIISEAIKRMCEQSGKGPIQVSRELGKSKAYLSATISRGNIPRLDTLLQIASACGYRVVLESDADRIELGDE